MTQYYKDTIYLKVTIETKSKQQFDSLFGYFSKLSKGNHSEIGFNKGKIYTCKFISQNGNLLTAILISNKRKRRNMLLIE